MVLLISPEQIELESCACAQIEARGEGNRWVYGIRYLGFIRKAGYCNIKKSLPFWSWFWIVLPFHHPNQPYYRDEGFCYTTDFLLALWVILGETNYMTHSFIQLVPFLCKLLIVLAIANAHFLTQSEITMRRSDFLTFFTASCWIEIKIEPFTAVCK